MAYVDLEGFHTIFLTIKYLYCAGVQYYKSLHMQGKLLDFSRQIWKEQQLTSQFSVHSMLLCILNWDVGYSLLPAGNKLSHSPYGI